MLNKNNIKGLLLDYGGTIDSNGVHWAVVLWQYYRQLQIPVSHEAFKEAYIHGERMLATHPLIKPEHNFYDLLLIKAKIQIDYLIEKGYLADNAEKIKYPEQVARLSYNFTRSTVKQAAETLEELSRNYTMVLVSNFYGNIHAVLADFGIQHYFKNIIESAVVGVRKPDPAIWTLGVQALGVEPKEAVVVGDSYDKDIVSGKQAGCQTIWLNVVGWDTPNNTSQADEIIDDFILLKQLINKNQ